MGSIRQKERALTRAEAAYKNAADAFKKARKRFKATGETSDLENEMQTGSIFMSVKDEIARRQAELDEAKDDDKKTQAELKAAGYNPQNHTSDYDPLYWLKFNRFSARTWLIVLGAIAFLLLCSRIG